MEPRHCGRRPLRARVSGGGRDARLTRPLVLLHGFGDSPRTWELALPALERELDEAGIETRETLRVQSEMVAYADWIELEGVGHSPQLDVPLEAAELILGFSGR